MLVRYAKISLVAAVALFLGLVVFNNLTDYGSNFAFVQHVLAMDTTFEGNRGMWRALTAPWVHHTFYAGIIAWEAAAFALCVAGAWRLWQARATGAAFEAAKGVAIAGLTVNLLLWMVAFITVGGEWFLMWQSRIWNGQDAAFRMFAIGGLVLVFLNQREKEE